MHVLKWLFILLTTPFWVPTLLTGIGIIIIALGVIIFLIWFFSLCAIIAILQVLYKLHLSLRAFYKKLWIFKWRWLTKS